ncbi:MAG: nitroreductase family protein [Syntrophobacter sp.]
MDVIDSIKQRRSVNFFEQGREIPDETLTNLLNVANLAPSSFNLQPWRVIVVRDKDRKRKLRECAMNQPKVEEASVVLIMIADPDGVEINRDRVLQRWVELGFIKSENKDMMVETMRKLYDEKESLTRKIFAVKNTALFAMNLMNTAQGLGLDTHPMDGIDADCIKREFSIPDDKVIPMIIAVGYLKPGISLLPRGFRRDLDEFVGIDTYK